MYHDISFQNSKKLLPNEDCESHRGQCLEGHVSMRVEMLPEVQVVAEKSLLSDRGKFSDICNDSQSGQVSLEKWKEADITAI